MSETTSVLCFLAAAVLLSAGYASVYGWVILLVVSTAMLVWWLFQRPGWHWLPVVLLVMDVSAAAGGVLVGKNAAWLVAAAAAALAGWELAGQREYRPGAYPRIQAALADRSHLRLLAVVIIAGLVCAEAGLFLQISIPFWGMFFAGLLILFCLYRFFQVIKQV
jgi:hypothetical protein